jgi:hypothetical protein
MQSTSDRISFADVMAVKETAKALGCIPIGCTHAPGGQREKVARHTFAEPIIHLCRFPAIRHYSLLSQPPRSDLALAFIVSRRRSLPAKLSPFE